tara:strand:+ start:1609 stop:2703 length:1095 start_codon:yes stop_codon:yes gene_type:complete
MKYYIIAGEASGDLHGSKVMESIKKLDKKAKFRFWGGEKMKGIGGEIVKHINQLSFMGFWEVLKNIKTILKNISFCKSDINTYQPDKIIYVDYPGFNMIIAKWAKINGFQNHFYISPQIWAWKESRIKKIKLYIDYLYVILPFEKEYYKKKHDLNVHYVGHPLVEIISDERKNKDLFPLTLTKPVIALLPGSRKQEIKKMIPVFKSVIHHFSNYEFIIAGVSNIGKEWYDEILKDDKIKIVYDKTYNLLKRSTAAIVTSGTATLETALFNVPQIVCYKSSLFSYLVGKLFIKLKFISLVNIIMEREVVKELIQKDCSKNNIVYELSKLLKKQNNLRVKNEYKKLRNRLGKKETSLKVAKLITKV